MSIIYSEKLCKIVEISNTFWVAKEVTFGIALVRFFIQSI